MSSQAQTASALGLTLAALISQPLLAEVAAAYPGRLDVINGDALEVDVLAHLTPPVRVVANLPYNIGIDFNLLYLKAEVVDAEEIQDFRFQADVAPTEAVFQSIDGKTLHRGLATLVTLCDATTGEPLAQLARGGPGHEKTLAHTLVDALPVGALDGKLIGGDALYADSALVRKLVQHHGALTVVQLKNNQLHAAPGQLVIDF